MPMFSEQDNPASFSPYLLTRYDATNQTKVFKRAVLTLFFFPYTWDVLQMRNEKTCFVVLITSPCCSQTSII